MENLHLSYKEVYDKEVYEELPYLLLLLMIDDKPRGVYNEEKIEVKKMSGKDLMRQKMGL